MAPLFSSGPNDHVFVNFVDHGAPGIVAFPDSELTARQLNSAIEEMAEAKEIRAGQDIYNSFCGNIFAKSFTKGLFMFFENYHHEHVYTSILSRVASWFSLY